MYIINGNYIKPEDKTFLNGYFEFRSDNPDKNSAINECLEFFKIKIENITKIEIKFFHRTVV